MWTAIGLMVVVGILADMVTKNKSIELKRLKHEIELEKLRLQTFDKETEKMRLELEQSKQALIEMKKDS
ncbi:hypothetical protein [Lysinibacillus odysseyi]|uniref:Flagellar cap protein n=1 Tax=Lysinibacillus odysseyi 34hs-1 = NBRC 100172 TaxID=1220589 RepID=A0A0A3IJP6_9BACI|nr:hypothetical protein [Lysinibacillus odysseyi]KGR84969.1 flagellar cap protein [Lysinibacillus odysseyi 34hs-1 = NBRC 100172]